MVSQQIPIGKGLKSHGKLSDSYIIKKVGNPMVNHQVPIGKGWNSMVNHQVPIGIGWKSTGKASGSFSLETILVGNSAAWT